MKLRIVRPYAEKVLRNATFHGAANVKRRDSPRVVEKYEEIGCYPTRHRGIRMGDCYLGFRGGRDVWIIILKAGVSEHASSQTN